MPDEVCSGNLLVEACGGLEDDRVRKDDYPACGLDVVSATAHFHQMNTDESDVNYIAGYSLDLHAIADTHSIASDQEEVAGYGQDYVLQGDGNSGGDESSEGC